VAVTCTLVDSAGNPVANEAVTFTIVSQPGVDASLTTVTVVTDEDGVATATLYTGSTPGLIVVEVEALGVSSQVSVVTGVEPGAAPPTGTSGAPAAIPASGAGGMAGNGPLYGPLAVGALVGAVVLAASAYVVLKRRAAI